MEDVRAQAEEFKRVVDGVREMYEHLKTPRVERDAGERQRIVAMLREACEFLNTTEVGLEAGEREHLVGRLREVYKYLGTAKEKLEEAGERENLMAAVRKISEDLERQLRRVDADARDRLERDRANRQAVDREGFRQIILTEGRVRHLGELIDTALSAVTQRLKAGSGSAAALSAATKLVADFQPKDEVVVAKHP